MTFSSYSVWSKETYLTRIAPRVGEVLRPPIDAECGPGPDRGQYRLYPGALFLLWVGAINGLKTSKEAEMVAAALEMLHNSSLVHDDVLDEHALRRGQPTLLGRFGRNYAVLAGDGLIGGALAALAGIESPYLRRRRAPGGSDDHHGGRSDE